ncbi:MAG: cobalamin adenosyltransferase [Euryarchaeota archaeon]|jgi:uncharacterized protein GlcG (DUF336 family)|nr:cobalamin adenosyltransferase [Euryarchaeota archaeon]|tara:strand:- start:183 stop:614 length:432 start_codon:yes stop_codon:yes gene_type:complete
MIFSRFDLEPQSGVKLATLAIEHANLNDWDITVAVCDTAGVLIAFMRTKNVIPAAVEFAIDKAYTSAILGKGTKEFGERMGSSVSLSLGVGTRSRLMTWTGGLPIFYKDNCVGGIGVSGAMDHQDLECAEAAISNLGLSSRAS